MRCVVLALGSLLLIGCGSSSSSTNSPEPVVVQDDTVGDTSNLAIPNNRALPAYNILMIGNSHVGSNNLKGLISTFIEHGLPEKSVSSGISGSQKYLIDRLNDGVTKQRIASEQWTHIILQAQKYSQSGFVDYPTRGTERWASIAKKAGATPILFPEHPRAGNNEEGMRVFELHQSIAEKQSACVAPIGPAWDKALAIDFTLPLHSSDGNHAALTGSFLTALVFYQVITGESADLLPNIESINVPFETQALLRQVASESIEEYGDCHYE
ncbi:hypothetical protein [Thalassotalea atypica]|uniref:hypothetical protein n=1 Tax=Thalassotalea atypica TaxID=2054316 RepID=UPI002572C9D9|nr:hypothetical protein [Thalassotalea atypica]